KTSIPSLYYNQRPGAEMVARRNWTQRWWSEERNRYEPYTSAVVVRELGRGEHPDKAEKLALLSGVSLLEVTEPVLQTAAFLVLNEAMPVDPFADAMHLALAAHNECDILLTWNCVHLANRNKLRHRKQLLREAESGNARRGDAVGFTGTNG
ncbi:MAG: type II toxin-antitoxin system VapC family toxin, partial [Limisphaerales bacterium]